MNAKKNWTFPALSRKRLEMTNNDHWRPFRLSIHRFVLLFGMTILLLFAGRLYGAEKNARKVVRIPSAPFDRLMVVDENRKPTSGYAFDYIQTIGTYAGWDIRYIPCESFSGCLEMLLAGEVDLFYDVSFTEERSKVILFPDEPMGYEYYYLYSSENNTSISPDDYASMNGKTVGVTSGTTTIEHLKQWCKRKNVELKLVDYPARTFIYSICRRATH